MKVTWNKKEITNPILRIMVSIFLVLVGLFLTIFALVIFVPFALLWRAIGNPFNLVVYEAE